MLDNQERYATGIKSELPVLSSPLLTSNEKEQLNCWIEELRQNGIAPESHIRLFVFEFVKYVGIDDLNFLVERFASHIVTKVNNWLDFEKNKAIAIGRDEERADTEAISRLKADLFKFISHSSDPDALPCLIYFISKCKDDNPAAYSELHLNGLLTIEFYRKLFVGKNPFKVDWIRSVLEPKHIINWLKKKSSEEYDELLRRVERHYAPDGQSKRNVEAAACLLIRGLAHCTDVQNSSRDIGDWYYEFLEALLSHGDCRFFARMIEPNYKDALDKRMAEKMVGDTKIDIEVINELVGEEERLSGPRDQLDFLKERKININWYEPEKYDLRPYQNELVIHANNGKNTIICAPTGSGKTLVAVEIFKNHLTNRHREGKIGRCVMVVPTVPLVEQQALHLVQFLMDYRDVYRSEVAYWVDGFSGCENFLEGRAKRLLAADIVVMTPQILINMLDSILLSERVYFEDFTLMIFDECHHTTKHHPYKILMEMLNKANLSERPQIVGLTASMGVGDTSYDIRACREHMLELCSNLHSETISTVRHQLDSLRSHVMPTVDEVIRVRRPNEDPFIEDIAHVMIKIQNDMKPNLLKLLDYCKMNKEEIEFPLHSFYSRYQTVVGNLRKCALRVQDSELRFSLVRSIDHLSHYFHAILIGDLLPNTYALEYLQEKMSNYEKPSTNGPIDQINRKLYEMYRDLHPKLTRYSQQEVIQRKEILKELYSCLDKQYKKDPDSRCLIFVATRNSAQKLADHLKRVPELPAFYKKENVGFMVSSNQSISASGQSTQEQQNMIRDFDRGRIKVLVVTSVAEEGVNIAACNLIIKYNNVGSERTLIQRRGRARQKNSRSVLLALDTGTEQAEYLNMQKEAMMMRCIEDLQEKSEAVLKKEISDKREQLMKLQESQLRALEAKRSRLAGRRYKISCRSCTNLICKSTFIRSIAGTTFVVCDPSVWKRSKIDIREKPTKDNLFTKCARWICSSCNSQEWGSIVKYSNCYLPQLIAGTFTLEREDQRDQLDELNGDGSRRTWAQVQDEFFNIEPMNLRNIKDMYSALMEAMKDVSKKMDQQEVIANIKYIEKMKEKKNERKNKIQIFLEE